MATKIIITVPTRDWAEEFMEDVRKTQSMCYIDANGDEQEVRVDHIVLEEE